jgi:hypothetical protein
VEPGCGFGVLFADYDLDGDPDLYVANDSSPNYLFRNEGQGHFAEVGLAANVAYGEMGLAQASMGVARGDVDDDGYPDILVTNFEDDYNTLYHNEGRGFFTDTISGKSFNNTKPGPTGRISSGRFWCFRSGWNRTSYKRPASA